MSAMLQTEEDVKNQDRIADNFAKFLDCEWRRMGTYCWFDVYFYKTPKLDFTGVAEIKCRNTKTFGSFPGVIIDVDKYQALYWNSLSIGCPAYFVVEYKEALVYTDISKICAHINKFEIKVIGRTDRGHPTDIRPAILIPKHYFSIV